LKILVNGGWEDLLFFEFIKFSKSNSHEHLSIQVAPKQEMSHQKPISIITTIIQDFYEDAIALF
jgi:hypothetical protein